MTSERNGDCCHTHWRSSQDTVVRRTSLPVELQTTSSGGACRADQLCSGICLLMYTLSERDTGRTKIRDENRH